MFLSALNFSVYSHQKNYTMDISIKDKTDWTLIFVWEFGKKFGLDMRQAFNYLKRYKGIAFIEKNYNYVHTQSFSSMVNDISEYCHRQGGALI